MENEKLDYDREMSFIIYRAARILIIVVSIGPIRKYLPEGTGNNNNNFTKLNKKFEYKYRFYICRDVKLMKWYMSGKY